MTESTVTSIEITREVPFTGEGDSLQSRLRKVNLRGFPKVKIYRDASFEIATLSPEQITSELHTPQLRVYRSHLKKIANLAELFKEKGIDILSLDKGYDYVATDEFGEQTEWTMLPPIVERFSIPRTESGSFNYEPLICRALAESLKEQGLGLNPQVLELPHTSGSEIFDLINDGSHRIQFGLEKGGISILRISGMTHGYPYYAAPQKYELVKVFETREEALKLPETKVHIVRSPGHKNLYRLFPSGGIMSGDVRPQKV